MLVFLALYAGLIGNRVVLLEFGGLYIDLCLIEVLA